MKTVVAFFCSILISALLQAQDISQKLAGGLRVLEADTQMKSAIVGFYVIDQKTGRTVLSRNSTIGFAVASSQKVITSVAALELLGNKYRYSTQLAYDGTIDNGVLNGNLYLTGNGDPTLGSWRYGGTKEQIVLNNWIGAIKQLGIFKLNGNIISTQNNFESQTIPGGWVWDDIGNYYGAGATALNWRENQYDMVLKSGSKEGDKVSIVSVSPKVYEANFTNELTTGKPSSGDNAYIYLPPYGTKAFVRGTIPPHENAFTISGSFPDPTGELLKLFKDELQRQQVDVGSVNIASSNFKALPKVVNLVTHLSPSLDSINYWCLKRSINLYGEALVKTIGFEKKNVGSAQAGLEVIKNFWKENGIETSSINMMDGSGLSPGNRVTPEALVKVMKYAHARPWFASFYNALPEINGIKMKSGSINGARSFTGYVGNYTFAIVINNYDGSPAEIVQKMFRLLDILK